jgi:hypothetical protein
MHRFPPGPARQRPESRRQPVPVGGVFGGEPCPNTQTETPQRVATGSRTARPARIDRPRRWPGGGLIGLRSGPRPPQSIRRSYINPPLGFLKISGITSVGHSSLWGDVRNSC